jgi:hypothetical protein
MNIVITAAATTTATADCALTTITTAISIYPSIHPSIYLFICLPVCLSIHLSRALQPFVRISPLFQFIDTYTVGRTPWKGDQPVARPLRTQDSTDTE